MIGRRRPRDEDCWKQNVSKRKRNKVRILVHGSKPFFNCVIETNKDSSSSSSSVASRYSIRALNFARLHGCAKMSDFMPNNHHFREMLIFFFYSKKTAAEAHRELQKVYGDAALGETTCHDWFRRFKDGDFDVVERPREGRPKTFEDADVIYYELLKPNETITGERYRTQLMRLSRAVREKRPQYEQRHEKSDSTACQRLV